MGKYLNHNLPQRKLIRLENWDYSSPGYYFCTICTRRSEHLLGRIKNGNIILSPEGELVRSIWNQIPHQFKNTRLDSFIIMPNHIHGIIQIIEDLPSINISSYICTDAINRVRTDIEPKSRGGITCSKNPMLSQHNLGKIIRWFKGRSTFEIRKECNSGFGWHGRFYDHIIRNESSLDYIRNYIANNPKNWKKDRFLVR